MTQILPTGRTLGVAGVFLVIATVAILLHAGPSSATRPLLNYRWLDGSAGTCHRNETLRLRFSWTNADGGDDVRTKIRIVNKRGKVLSATSAKVQNNKPALMRFRAVWRKGRYTIRFYGVDGNGDRSWFYPYKVHFVIY